MQFHVWPLGVSIDNVLWRNQLWGAWYILLSCSKCLTSECLYINEIHKLSKLLIEYLSLFCLDCQRFSTAKLCTSEYQYTVVIKWVNNNTTLTVGWGLYFFMDIERSWRRFSRRPTQPCQMFSLFIANVKVYRWKNNNLCIALLYIYSPSICSLGWPYQGTFILTWRLLYCHDM